MVALSLSLCLFHCSFLPLPSLALDEGGKAPYYRKSSFSNNATEALHAPPRLPSIRSLSYSFSSSFLSLDATRRTEV